MNWYFKQIIAQTFPLETVVNPADLNQPGIQYLTSLPNGYIVRREKDGGWTILNPDGGVLVEDETDPEGDAQKALDRAIRSALLRINQKLSQRI